MSVQAFILFPDRRSWRVGTIRNDAPDLREVPADNGESAPNVAAALREIGYSRGDEVVLAVPSHLCFAATIDIGDLPAHDRKSMLYRLEEKFPFPAEEFVADFAGADDSGRALGIAVLTAQMKPLVDVLEQTGIAVQSIVPAALLAVQGIDSQASDELRAILFGNGQSVDLVLVRDEKLVDFSISPNAREGVSLALEIAASRLGATPQVFACDLKNSIVEAQEIRGSLDALATRGAQSIAAGRASPWIELRRDALSVPDRLRGHRAALNAALAAAAILFIAIAGTSLLRAHQYERLSGANEEKLWTEFARAHPGWERPASVKALIQSERRKLALSPHQPSSTVPGASALQTMQSVLGPLPSNSGFTLDRMTFQDSSFELQGRASSLDGMSGIAAAARHAGWNVPQPEGHRNSDGFWSFTLRGSSGTGELAVRADQDQRQ